MLRLPRSFGLLLFGLLLVADVAGTRTARSADAPPADRFAPTIPLPPELFDVIDPNGDGAMEPVEAKQAEAAILRLSKTRQALGQAVRDAFDADGDRKVDADEIRRGLERAKNTYRGRSAEIVLIVERLDTDQDRTISPHEFRRLAEETGVLAAAVRLRHAHLFNLLDRDRDGSVTAEELTAASSALTAQFQAIEAEARRQAMQKHPQHAQTERLFNALDTNQDHYLTREETVQNKPITDAFNQIDTSSDNQLSLEECFEFVKRRASGKTSN